MKPIKILSLSLFSFFSLCQINPSPGQVKATQNIPNYFMPNLETSKTGKRLVQNDEVFAFLQGKMGRVLFTQDGAYFALVTSDQEMTSSSLKEIDPIHEGKQSLLSSFKKQPSVFKVGFSKAHASKRKIQPRFESQTEAKVNFFIGPKSEWKTGIPTYKALVYENVWDGVSLKYTAHQNSLTYSLMLEPGANPDFIVMESGVERIQIGKNGILQLKAADNQLVLPKVNAFQVLAGRKTPVEVNYHVLSNGNYGFKLGSYDSKREVEIEQQLIWSTYFGSEGGFGTERVYGLKVDNTGNTYITGVTPSGDFPTSNGAYDTSWNGGESDVFVTKLNATGTDFIYSTFIGGSGIDVCSDIALDSMGSAYIVGHTNSIDFPSTPGALTSELSDEPRLFVAKLNDAGTDLEYVATLNGTDSGIYNTLFSISVDSNFKVFISGNTDDSSFPTTEGAFDRTYNGSGDIFVIKLNPSGSDLEFATFIGGTSSDVCRDMAIDASGSVYLTGETNSIAIPDKDLPTTTKNHGKEVFAIKLSNDGSELLYSKIWGGEGTDTGFGIAVDSGQNAHVTGYTLSNDFPTTLGAFIEEAPGTLNAFVTKLDSLGSDFVYSTFLGGSSREFGQFIAIDSGGNALAVGDTDSIDFPVTPGVIGPNNTSESYEIYLTKLNAMGTESIFSTYFGRSYSERVTGFDLDTSDNLYLAGYTTSPDFPTTENAFDRTHNLFDELFVTKINGSGTLLDFSTFVAGFGGEDSIGITLDQQSNPIVVGNTSSVNFPTTEGAFDSSFHRHYDIYVSKVKSDGTGLIFSTFIGGMGVDNVHGVALDSLSNIYFTGRTSSPDFPTTPGAFDENYNDFYDTYAAKLNRSGDSLIFSTFLGGSKSDEAKDIAVDLEGNFYLTGFTRSPDFPTTPNAYDTTLGDFQNAFVSKMDATASELLFSTYLGSEDQGSDYSEELGVSIAINQNSEVYVLGQTPSSSFPTTQNAYDQSFNGDVDIFISKLDLSGELLLFSSFLGGDSYDIATELFVGSQSRIFFTGGTVSSNFPTTQNAFDTTRNDSVDVIVAEMNPDGSELLYSTFLGGGTGFGLGMDTKGYLYVTGTVRDNYPVTPCALEFRPNDSVGIFLTKFKVGNSYLDYSTIFGGSDRDMAAGLDMDPQNNVYIFGTSYSADFLTTPGVVRESQGGYGDAFITKITPLDLVQPLPSSNVLGLSTPEFDISLNCDLNGVTTSWTATPPTPLVPNGTGILLDPPPAVTTQLVATVMSEGDIVGETTASLLVASNPNYLDVNGDGCNNLEDLWSLLPQWLMPEQNDGNGDGILDIRDFLFLNLSDPTPCP